MSLTTIIGCGNIGEQLAEYLKKRGHQVTALVRTAERKEALQKRGIIPIIGDLDHPESLGDLNFTDDQVVFYLVPPPQQDLQDQRVQHLIQHMERRGQPGRVIYISTSGVYGDCRGAWVDEDTPTQAVTPRAKRRLWAEQAWQQWAQVPGRRLVILRVGGIYGPGRLPVKRLQKGLPILAETESPFSNRIHSEDLIRVCMAAADNNSIPKVRVYNVSDGHPTTMSHYFKAVARLLNLPLPPEVDWQGAEAELTPELLSYLKESRRMDNSRMLEELGVRLVYPELDIGLQACL